MSLRRLRASSRCRRAEPGRFGAAGKVRELDAGTCAQGGLIRVRGGHGRTGGLAAHRVLTAGTREGNVTLPARQDRVVVARQKRLRRRGRRTCG